MGGEVTSLVLLPAVRSSRSLQKSTLQKLGAFGVGVSSGHPATRADAWVIRNTLSIDAIGASRRDAARNGEDPALVLNRKRSRDERAARAGPSAAPPPARGPAHRSATR